MLKGANPPRPIPYQYHRLIEAPFMSLNPSSRSIGTLGAVEPL